MAQLGVPLRIRSSSSSTSSLSSTFSDLASSTSTASSSPPHSKTSAFFASPFSTRPPSPAPPQMHQLRSDKPRSLTADFFATSVRPPSPPASARGPSSSISSIPPSSIFPSRYTSLANPDRTRDFTILSPDDSAPHAYYPLPAHHSRTSSAGSDDLPAFSSPTSPTFGVPRLPTPPPPKHHRAVAREDTIMPARDADMHDEPTPRPAPREPALLKFERSLLLARQTETVEAEEVVEEEEEEVEQEELKEGSIISLPPSIAHFNGGSGLSPPVRAVPLPISPLALAFTLGPMDPVMNDRGTPTPTPMSEPSSVSGSTLSPIISLVPISSSPTDIVDHYMASNSNISISRSNSTLSSSTSGVLPSPVYRAMALGPSVSTSSSSHSISRSSSYSPRNEPPSLTPGPAPQLRLLRPLGHGAFSAVWLAEDLSRVPLALVSKKSVRDLRRKASVRERDDKHSENVDLERDHEWKMLQDKTRTPDGSQPQFDFGELDVTPRPPAAVPSATLLAQTQTPMSNPKESPKRQANRLREGLRNMLAFSRGASATPTAVHTQASSSTAAPHSSFSVDTDKPAAMHVDSEPPPASPMSSSSSVHSADFSPVSRASSLRSSTGGAEPLSRASSSGTRLAPALRGEGDTDKAAALLRDASLRKFRARVRGTRPALGLAPGRACLDERDGEMGLERVHGAGQGDYLREGEGEREVLLSSLARKSSSSAGAGGGGGARSGRLVAVKMTARRAPKGASPPARGGATGKKDARHRERERVRAKARREEEERTRVRFVREVEVLKHISHPNITPLLAHLSTATHHILVLPYLPGGDLLGLVNNDIAWGKLTESVLRRVWVELCKAVGWMHGVGLVHRDIKLENILLTTPTFSALDASSPPPDLSALPAPPAPFIKLTDFGLSRFVALTADGEAEPLSTRCGSEAYAAPELVTGGGVYDARKTDAWACGVVLYALVGRVLPFGEGDAAGAGTGTGAAARIGGERGEEGRVATPAERRHWLMRIARGEWTWPEEGDEEPHDPSAVEGAPAELVGAGLVRSRGARRVVSRLLVRNTRKRARIADLWDDAWMAGGAAAPAEEGAEEERAGTPCAPSRGASGDDVLLRAERRVEEPAAQVQTGPWDGDAPEFWKDAEDVSFYDEPTWMEGFSEGLSGEEARLDDEGDGEDGEEEEEEDGCLLDQEGIDSITRQEVV